MKYSWFSLYFGPSSVFQPLISPIFPCLIRWFVSGHCSASTHTVLCAFWVLLNLADCVITTSRFGFLSAPRWEPGMSQDWSTCPSDTRIATKSRLPDWDGMWEAVLVLSKSIHGLIRSPLTAHLTLCLSSRPYIFALALNVITFGIGLSVRRGSSLVHVLSYVSCQSISSPQALAQYSASKSCMASTSDLAAGGGGLQSIFVGNLFE